MPRLALGFAVPAVLLLTASYLPAQVGSPAWTAARVAVLQGNNSAARNTARQELMSVVDKPGFPVTYPASLAPDLLALLKSSNPRVQLNAAVIAEHLADNTADPALIPVATALLESKSDALALWGVKTARPYVAAGNVKLASHIVAAVKTHEDSGPIAEEAYRTLVSANGAAGKGTAAATLPDVLNVLESRTRLYSSASAPPSPGAEAPVPVFLSITCWPAASAAERKRILSDLGDLACSGTQSIADGNANAAVPQVVHEAATALGTIATHLNNAPLAASAKTLEGISAANAPQRVTSCQSLQSAIKTALP
jgi:hypothetical protein